MSPFYTAKGDQGKTGLPGNRRISKADPLLEAIGTIDEVNSSIGFARAQSQLPLTKEILLHVQKDLYRLMASVAAAKPDQTNPTDITDIDIAWIEDQIHLIENKVSMPKGFIIPGDTVPEAALDTARTLVRRGERRITGMQDSGLTIKPNTLRYLNRLSSLCFALELLENHAADVEQPTSASNK